MTFLHAHYPLLVPLAGAAVVALAGWIYARPRHRRHRRRQRMLDEAWD